MTQTMTDSITITRTSLLTALGHVALVAAKGSSRLPISQAVRITPEANGLRFTATDYDRTVTAVALADGAEDFPPRVVPCHRLLSVVSQLPLGTIVVAPTKNGIRVSAQGARFDLSGLPLDEFPRAEVGKAGDAEMDGPAFLGALSRCVTHCSDAPSRPVINGVHVLAPKNGPITMQATDGTCLVREVVQRAKGPALDIIIHRASVPVMAKLFAACERISLGISQVQAVVSADDDSVAMEMRLIEGPFVTTSMYLDASLPLTASVDRVALLTAAKRVASLSAAQMLCVALEWDADRVTLRGVGDEDSGSSEDAVACSYNGPPLTLCFAPRTLITALSVRGGDTIRVGMKDEKSHMNLRDDGVVSVQGVAMPRRDPRR